MADEFRNKVVLRFAAREFWLDGQLISPCSPIFVEMEDRRTWMIFYDDERYEWAIEPSILEFPTIGEEAGDDTMKWVDSELGGGTTFMGRPVKAFEASTSKTAAVGVLRFDGSLSLNLTHDYETERSSYSVAE